MTPRRVLITRALDAAKATEKHVAARNHIPIVFPLFEIAYLPSDLPAEAFDDVVFTSRNAIHSLSKQGFDPMAVRGCTWCVGGKTAELAEQSGYPAIQMGKGDAKSLAEKIIVKRANTKSRVFYPATRTPSFDLKTTLSEYDIEVLQTVAYEQRPVFPDPVELQQMMHAKEPDTVFIHSKNSGLHTSRVLFETEGFDIPTLDAIAISPQCADSLLKYPWANVYSASTPTEAAMLDQIV